MVNSASKQNTIKMNQ